MLPEDLAEMLREQGPAMTDTEIERLSNRLSRRQEEPCRIGMLAKVEHLPKATFSAK